MAQMTQVAQARSWNGALPTISHTSLAGFIIEIVYRQRSARPSATRSTHLPCQFLAVLAQESLAWQLTEYLSVI